MDIASWFVDTAALAGIIVTVVAFLKEHILTALHGAWTIVVSLAVGVVFGVGGHLLGHVEGGLMAGVTFGAAAGFIASGGWDAIKGLLGKRE